MPAPQPTLDLYRSLAAGYEFVNVNGTTFERTLTEEPPGSGALTRGEWVKIGLTREQIRVGRERADASGTNDRGLLYYWRALDACAWQAKLSTFRVSDGADQLRQEMTALANRLRALEESTARQHAVLTAAARGETQAIAMRVPELPVRGAA